MANFPFQRLQADLSSLIARTSAGDRLPSEPDLARTLGVSRATLREAMRTFEAQGLIRRRQGSGTFVVGQVPVLEAGLELLESLETMADRLGLEVTVSDLHVETVPATEQTAHGLGVAVDTLVTRVRRVMREESRPVAYLVDTLPQDVLRPEQLPSNFKGSVLDFLLSRGDQLTVSKAAISAMGAPADVAKALQIQRGDVLLEFVSKLFHSGGKILDYSFSYFIPGYFHFHVVRRVGG
ncbi:MAG TPA: GntR family transcriptional regulator [Anaerolineales bacterium]|nr:GntR family transcriptional regulator [Anaerolineales bacterium]